MPAGVAARGVPFVLPPLEAAGGRAALSRWSVFIGNLVRHVVHTGTGLQNTAALD